MLSSYHFDDSTNIRGHSSQFGLPVFHMSQVLTSVDVELEETILKCVVGLPARPIDGQLGLHACSLKVTWEREHGFISGRFRFAV